MDPEFNNAKRLLVDANSVVVFDSNRTKAAVRRLVRYWILQEREHRDECITYLKSVSVISDFETTTGPIAGDFRQIDATYSEEDGELRIVQQLEAEVNSAAAISQAASRWRYRGGSEFQSGSGMVVLELPFCDPEHMQAMAKENSLKSYTDAIYTTNGGVLAGKWYSIKQDPVINPETGYGTITWYLSRYYNQDLYFPWKRSATEQAADFFKLHMPPDTVQTFFSTYYFDASAFYVSADGVNYTNKNGEATEEVMLPNTARRLDWHDSGRVVQIHESPDAEKNEVMLHVSLSWAADVDESGVIVRNAIGSIATEIELHAVTKERSDAFLKHTVIDRDGNWYYSENGVAYSSKNAVAVVLADGEFYPALPDAADWASIGEDFEGRTLRIQRAYIDGRDRWNVRVFSLQSVSDVRTSFVGVDTRVGFRTSRDVSLLVDKAYGVSYVELAAARLHYNTDPGAGTVRQIDFTRMEDGRYNYSATEVSTTSVIAEFTIGNKTTHFGFHSKKKPTTKVSLGGWENNGGVIENGTHVLVGGYVYGGVFKCSIDPDSDLNPAVRYEQDATWSWNIEVEGDQGSIIYGLDENDAETDVLFKYGLPEDEWKWVGRHLYEEISKGNIIDLTGRYGVISGEHASFVDYTKEAENFDVNTGWTQKDLSVYGEGSGMAPASAGTNMAFQNINFGSSGLDSTLTFRTVAPYVAGGAHTTIEVRDGSVGGTVLCILDCTPAPWQNTAAVETHDYTVNLTGIHSIYFVGGSVSATPASLNWWNYQEGAYVEGEFGKHGDLTGRRIVFRQLKNEQIINGKLSYDVFENTVTADIEDDDGWFIVGATEGTDRNKLTLASMAVSSTDDAVTSATVLGEGGNKFVRLEAATIRRKVSMLEFKLFVRRPRIADLVSSGIYDEMMAACDETTEPDSRLVRTYREVKFSSTSYAVERTTVRVGSVFHVDEDAITRYRATGGRSACRRVEISVSECEAMQ